MVEIIVYRFSGVGMDAERRPDSDFFVEGLKKLPGTRVSELECEKFSEIGLVPQAAVAVLIDPPAILSALAAQAARQRRSFFIAGCVAGVTEKMDDWELAGVIPDLGLRHSNGGYLGYGHKSVVNLLQSGLPPLQRHHALFSMAKNGHPAGELAEYFRLYTALIDQLWPPQPVPVQNREEETVKPSKRPARRAYDLPGNDWEETLKQRQAEAEKVQTNAEKPPVSNPVVSTGEELRQTEQLRKAMRENIFSGGFLSRTAVREAIQQNDREALLRQLQREMTGDFCLRSFSKTGWPDVRTWYDVRFLQRVGKEKGDLTTDELDGRKTVQMENGSQWAEIASADILITKTLMGRYDPEVVARVQKATDDNGPELLLQLQNSVRHFLRNMSTRTANSRIMTRAGKLEQLNASYWGNEQAVTLSVFPGSEGWTHELPFTRKEIEVMAEEILAEPVGEERS